MRKCFPFIICILTVLQLIVGCSIKRPSNILSPGKMEDILYDYHVARSMSEDLRYDEIYKQKYYIQGVLDKYGISQAEFDTSMVWYSRNTEDMADIYERVQKRLQENLNDINKLIASNDETATMSKSGDNVDLWTKNRVNRLMGDDYHNRLSFTMSSDSTYHQGDSFEWSVNFLSAGNDMSHPAIMSLTIRLINDSTITRTEQIQGSGIHSIRVQNNAAIPINSVSGFIYLSKASQNVFVAQIKWLKRFHAHGPLPTPTPNGPMGAAPNSQNLTPNPSITPGSPAPNAPNNAAQKTDTAKAIALPHRITPEELNKKSSQTGQPRDYQIRQQELEKELFKQKKPKKTTARP